MRNIDIKTSPLRLNIAGLATLSAISSSIFSVVAPTFLGPGAFLLAVNLAPAYLICALRLSQRRVNQLEHPPLNPNVFILALCTILVFGSSLLFTDSDVFKGMVVESVIVAIAGGFIGLMMTYAEDGKES